jgi:phosphoribosylanthranilate isomerase
MYLKICGITRTIDAKNAIELGVDALGIVAFPPSKRYITPSQVKELIAELKNEELELPELVAVMVDPVQVEVERYLAAGIDIIQLHGHESVEFVNGLGCRCWKAFNIQSQDQIAPLASYQVEKFLVDSFVNGAKVPGGSGIVADWELSRLAVEQLDRPVILAGGISAENLDQAWREVAPFGFDVSSSIEKFPGHKDHGMMIELIEKFNQLKEENR